MIRTDEPPRRIAVLGGGISGLAAAYALARARKAGAPIEEYLLEATERLGGVIRTERIEGFVVEAGPDSFLAEKPEAAALCRELGLGDSLLGSNDSERRTYVLHRGRLVRLPEGFMLLVPTRLWPVVTTPLLSLRSKLALAREWFASRPPKNSEQPADESVASFVGRHFGKAMLENIAEPLLAGVYGGDSGALSVRSVLPRFYEMKQKHGSLTRAMLKARRKRLGGSHDAPVGVPFAPPLFMTLEGGLEQIVERLERSLENTRVFKTQQVTGIEARPSLSTRYRIRCQGDISHEADAIILAIPAYECSRFLGPLDPTLGELLAGIPYSSALTVALAYEVGASRRLPPGFGFLVPRKEKRRLLACTFVHAKFAHRAPEGKALLRCFLGGAGDPEILNSSDTEILAMVQRELRKILDFSLEPSFYRIYRWPLSMAQYVVGHTERMNAIQARLNDLPGVQLAGNAYSGIGLSDCIRTGKAAAEKVLASLFPGTR